jgi:myo-inositol 2-dehydrogenase/D-chiro-inositol 1-dehydrogenase
VTASAPVRVGVVGLGRLGRFHAANIHGRTPALDLVRVVDAAEATARAVGEALGVPWSTRYDDLLNDPTIEAVVIVTPTPLHAAMIEQAAAAGKQIFCEKPIAPDMASAEHAIRAAEAAGVRLQIGFHRRFDPDYAAAARRIRAGELGDVYLLRSAFRDMRPPPVEFLRDSGGFMLDMMIHDLDMARWLVGEVEEVTSFGTTLADPRIAEIGDVDHAILVLRFASGALGVLDGSRAAGYGYECSTEIVGSRATARIAADRRVNVEWLTPGAATVDYVADFVERFPLAYLRELEDFADAVRHDRPAGVDGRDGLAALVLALAADRSLREGRTVRVREVAPPTRADGAG